VAAVRAERFPAGLERQPALVWQGRCADHSRRAEGPAAGQGATLLIKEMEMKAAENRSKPALARAASRSPCCCQMAGCKTQNQPSG